VRIGKVHASASSARADPATKRHIEFFPCAAPARTAEREEGRGSIPDWFSKSESSLNTYMTIRRHRAVDQDRGENDKTVRASGCKPSSWYSSPRNTSIVIRTAERGERNGSGSPRAWRPRRTCLCDDRFPRSIVSVQASISTCSPICAMCWDHYIFISHDISVVSHIADRVVVMFAARS